MKKSSLLLQRPIRTFDDEAPELSSHVLEVEDGAPQGFVPNPEPAQQGSVPDLKVRKPRVTVKPRVSSGNQDLGGDAESKFGPLTVDLAKAKRREPKGLLTTTVPSPLHVRLMQREDGPSGFINLAVEKFLRTHLNQVVEAGYRLADLRVSQAEDSRTISARSPITLVVDVDEAVKYVTHNLERVSAAFVVGGCVMLLAEEQGLVNGD